LRGRDGILRQVRWAIFAGAAVVCFAATVLNGFLDNSFVASAPRAPDPLTMKPVPYVVKRVLVYVSEDQRELISWLRWIEVVSGGVILANVLLNLKWPISSR
jgi:hypothetical protein